MSHLIAAKASRRLVGWFVSLLVKGAILILKECRTINLCNMKSGYVFCLELIVCSQI